jgi:hypothetical protein
MDQRAIISEKFTQAQVPINRRVQGRMQVIMSVDAFDARLMIRSVHSQAKRHWLSQHITCHLSHLTGVTIYLASGLGR